MSQQAIEKEHQEELDYVRKKADYVADVRAKKQAEAQRTLEAMRKQQAQQSAENPVLYSPACKSK